MTNKELERANELNHCIREYEDVKVELENWMKGPKKKITIELPIGRKQSAPKKQKLIIRQPYCYSAINFEVNNEMLAAILKEVERQLQEFRKEFANIGKDTNWTGRPIFPHEAKS